MAGLLALAFATLALVAIPGPNVALIIANTLSYGFRFGALTVLGTTIGVAVQVAVVMSGLAALTSHAVVWLVWIKWIGVVYLIWLGMRTWRSPAGALGEVDPSAQTAWKVSAQGCVMSVINPKTLVFNIAFLPQFLPLDSQPIQIFAVAATYLAVLCLGDMVWAGCAQMARPFMIRVAKIRNKLTGGLFLLSGVGLGLSRAGV